MISIQPPPRTLLEVFRMLPEGTRAELIEDQLYMSPAPQPQHQKIVFEIIGQFYVLLSKRDIGEVFPSPIDVFLNEKNVFQPDIVFVSDKNSKRVGEHGITGAPDLIIEVISPGSRTIDLVRKKDQYEAAGVGEYWVVDPKTKICTGFRLVNGNYRSIAKEKGKLVSPLLRHTFKV